MHDKHDAEGDVQDEWVEEVLLMKEISDEMLRAEHQLSCRLSRTLEETAAAEYMHSEQDTKMHQSMLYTVNQLNDQVLALQNQEQKEVQALHGMLKVRKMICVSLVVMEGWSSW
jgi:hypothetical protein